MWGLRESPQFKECDSHLRLTSSDIHLKVYFLRVHPKSDSGSSSGRLQVVPKSDSGIFKSASGKVTPKWSQVRLRKKHVGYSGLKRT